MSDFEEVGLYEILGVDDHNEDIKEIRKKYIKLVMKFHPDKNKNADPEILELIQKAWNILGNPKKREEYDIFLKNKENNIRSHDVLKNDFKKFQELDYTKFNLLGITKEEYIDKIKDQFNNLNKELDDKYSLQFNDKNNNLDDLIYQREQEDIEFTNDKIFDDNDQFNLAKFNSIFDKYNNKNNNKSLILSEPMAYEITQYASANLSSYDKLYDETNNTGNYYSLSNFGNELKINKDNIKNIKDADYTNNYKLSDLEKFNLNDNINNFLKNRESETNKLINMTYNDFNNNERMYKFLDDDNDKYTLDKDLIDKFKNI